MSLNNFIPEVWSGNLLQSLDKAHVAASVANRSYEGDISAAGDTVRINQIGDITVSSYSKNTNISDPEDLVSAQNVLTIDQQKYFNFQIDDIDKAQAKPKVMQEAMRKSGYALNDTGDSYLLGLHAQAGIAVYTDATPLDMTSANVEDGFLQVAEAMDEANIPREGRFAIIPPWVHTKLVLAGLTTKTANDALFNNGQLGFVLGFDMLLSNNVSNAGSWAKSRLMCGVRGLSLNYAEQIISVEGYRMEKRFSDAVKGLHVYGGKWRSDATTVFYADKTAEA